MLVGERALVVGASGALGGAIALDLLDHGCEVIACCHTGERRLAEVAAGRADGERLWIQRLDVRSADEVLAVTSRVIEARGCPSIIVYCAGVVRDVPLHLASEDDWLSVLDVNLSGAVRILRAFAAPLIKQQRGRVILITSVSALHGLPGQAAYAAAKAGLVGLTRVMSRELGPFHVTANAIAPGPVEGDMLAGMSPDARRRLLSRIPLRRFATPSDIAPLVSFLASPAGGYITGQTFVVDGGLTA